MLKQEVETFPPPVRLYLEQDKVLVSSQDVGHDFGETGNCCYAGSRNGTRIKTGLCERPPGSSSD